MIDERDRPEKIVISLEMLQAGSAYLAKRYRDSDRRLEDASYEDIASLLLVVLSVGKSHAKLDDVVSEYAAA